MKSVPVVRQYAWAAVVPQLLILSLIVLLLSALTHLRLSTVIAMGVALYFLSMSIIRSIVARAHKAGMRNVRKGDFAGAILCFEESYTFFSRHDWVDRLRFLVLGSSSRASYREMALVNIAFCYAQNGEGRMSRIYYERAAKEFPESTLAVAGLNMAHAFESAQNSAANDI